MPHKDQAVRKAYHREYGKTYYDRQEVKERRRFHNRRWPHTPETRARNVTAMIERRRARKLVLIAEHGGCCSVCGYAGHPASLDFDHVDPSTKVADIAKLLSSGRHVAALRAEAAKCRLVCSNCHREKTVTGAYPERTEWIGACA